ncbi:MAG: sugar phosphate isomerase/epimerase [Spirochaetales bacterium]|nr:sugar phosphate isomerase/epimerase [Spirochaetales bacterium]
MKLSICLSTNPAKFSAVSFKGDLQKNIKTIKRLGYDGVELAIRDPEIIDQKALLDMTAEEGLRISAIGTGQAWGEEGLSYTDENAEIRRKAIDRTLSHIPMAKKTGAVIIIGLLRGIYSSNVSREQAFSWMKQAFSESCRAAAAEGVRIAFEPINRFEVNSLNSVREGSSFIEDVGEDNLGMLLDTFHMNIEEPSIEESIKTAGDRIFHFHYADSNRWYPGAGHLDFRSILEALFSTGYEGFVSGEHMPDPDAEQSARLGIAYMRNIEKVIEKKQ